MMAAEQHSGMLLSELLEGRAQVAVTDDRRVEGLSLDSRAVQPGDCFLALPGSRAHGAEFAAAALDAGASAILTEERGLTTLHDAPVLYVSELGSQVGAIADRFYGSPSKAMTTVAVTGTNGKTTTSHLLAQAIQRRQGQCGYIGTLGIGSLDALRPSGNTTPDAITLHRFLRECLDRGCRTAVLEASSHALTQKRLDGMRLSVAVYMNIGHDHLDYHGTFEAYAAAKKSLFGYLGLEHAVVNFDDPLGGEILKSLDPNVTAWAFTGADATLPNARHRLVRGGPWRGDLNGGEFTVTYGADEALLRCPLVGAFNRDNCLATVCVLLALGWDLEAATGALAATSPVPGRMQCLTRGGNHTPTVVIDYAHSPDSLEAALRSLRPLTAGRLLCVFGCGGDRDRSKRAPMGAVAENHADRVILTSDNPRSEDEAVIAREVLAGMRRSDDVEVILARDQAIAFAIRNATARDTVIIAGKGHECYQERDGRRYEFSDLDTASAVLSEVSV